MHQKLVDLYFEVLKHPASSPDLASSDCYLFLNLKGRKFFIIEEAKIVADRWFATQSEEFFLDGLKKLEQRRLKCVELREEYAE
jgi:hypothetical protein